MNKQSLILIFPIFGAIFGLWISPSTADEVRQIPVEEVKNPEVSTGTVQDLRELPSKDLSEWFSNQSSSNRGVDSNLYQIDNGSYKAAPSVDFLEEQNQWKNTNHGDVQPVSGSIDLTKF
ncbi:hypothetical protein [Gloeothece verrucosa]|uniref:Uncharacterized protein n=1 Tax=Gloeothece verrucosa (strain PCC 7822) TaxID=497965 RepID=E0UF72_GLOV7|nr:hypothetical protein [Gloeothece verrucosa]ADN15443.1 hypothetical protein Cyan7822_3501 [Gloeothece verrucosa PCC 7822]